MSTLPNQDYISDSDRKVSEVKSALEDMRDVIAQGIGQSARTTISIETGGIIPTRSAHLLQSESSTSDTLDVITSTNLPEGSLLLLGPAPGHDITIAHSSNLSLIDGENFLMDDDTMRILLMRVGTDWVEVTRFYNANTTAFKAFLDVSGGGGGEGSVTSVAISAPSTIFSVSGSPVTSSGTLTLSFATGQTANRVVGTNGAGAVSLLALTDSHIPALPASKITTGTFNTAQIPNLDAAKITSGSIDTARIPNLAASKITSGTFDAARIPDLAASKITSGQLTSARGGLGRDMETLAVSGSQGILPYWNQLSDGTNQCEIVQHNLGDAGFALAFEDVAGVVSNLVRYDYKQGEEKTVPSNSSVSWAHGATKSGAVTGKPLDLRVVLRCKTADLGYAVGDEVEVFVTGSTANQGYAVCVDDTNISVAGRGNYLMAHKAGSSAHSTITNASWRFVAYWRFAGHMKDE